jgi:hypothetical protein
MAYAETSAERGEIVVRQDTRNLMCKARPLKLADLTQFAVPQNHDQEWQMMMHGGDQLEGAHHQRAVPLERDYVAAGAAERSPNRRGNRVAHTRKIDWREKRLRRIETQGFRCVKEAIAAIGNINRIAW